MHAKWSMQARERHWGKWGQMSVKTKLHASSKKKVKFNTDNYVISSQLTCYSWIICFSIGVSKNMFIQIPNEKVAQLCKISLRAASHHKRKWKSDFVGLRRKNVATLLVIWENASLTLDPTFSITAYISMPSVMAMGISFGEAESLWCSNRRVAPLPYVSDCFWARWRLWKTLHGIQNKPQVFQWGKSGKQYLFQWTNHMTWKNSLSSPLNSMMPVILQAKHLIAI